MFVCVLVSLQVPSRSTAMFTRPAALPSRNENPKRSWRPGAWTRLPATHDGVTGVPARRRSPSSSNPFGRFDETPLVGVGGGAGTGGDPDLDEDVADVAGHRALADAQVPRDGPVGVAARDPHEDLDLPRRERARGPVDGVARC